MAERVEVKLDDAACAGAWFPATLLKKISDNSFLVEYKRSSFGNTLKHWRGIVDSINVRPFPPNLHKETFDLLEKVEAFYNFGWLNGVITNVLPDQKYVVFFKHRNEEREFRRSDLRLHMDWINSKWFLDTKEVTVVELDEGNGNFPNLTASSSCSTGMDTQLTPSVVIEKSLGKVTSSSRNDAGRVDYDTTVGEADSPCCPLSSSQKDTEQSIPKGNNDLLGPHQKVRGQNTTDISMPIRACSERGMSTGSCNDVEADSMFSSPSPKGTRSKIEFRRARNSFSSELFFNSSGSPTGGNHVSLEIGEEKPKDDLESKSFEIKVSTCSHLNSDLMEVERFVVLSSPRSNTQCVEEQKVVLSTKQMKETSTPIQEEDMVNTQSGITVKRKRGRPKGSGNKKKANTSGSPNFRIISPLKGPEKDSSSTKNTNVQTQCSELPTSSTAEYAKTQCLELPSSTVDKTQCSELRSLAVTNHQMPSVHLERSGISAVGNTGTKTEAGNRNLIDEFYSVQMENIKVDTDQTLSLVPGMSNGPTNEIGLESESACTENIAVGTVLDLICPPILSPTIEEHQTRSPTPYHANQAIESKAVMDMTNGEINETQMLCPSILEKPLIVENNEDIQVALDEAMDETPLHSVMDFKQPLIAPQNSPVPVVHEEHQIRLFEKKSAMWKLLDELEVFQSNPQNPHFSPLENEPEEFREGKALFMCAFESLANNANNASVEEESHVLENRLGALNKLEEHGFNVSSMRWKLAKMIEIKDKLDEVGNRPDSSKLEIEEAENELKDLERQLETLFAREARLTLNLARLRELRDEAEERARQLRLEFYHVASAP